MELQHQPLNVRYAAGSSNERHQLSFWYLLLLLPRHAGLLLLWLLQRAGRFPVDAARQSWNMALAGSFPAAAAAACMCAIAAVLGSTELT
jgi:hypothetical protein